jgi:hypothetical protein
MEIKDKLAQYKQYKEELSAELRKYVQDKNNPLDERFEALCECLEFSKRAWRNTFGLDRNDEFLYEYPCYMSKYQVSSVKSILDLLIETRKEEGNEDWDYFTPEEETTFKEYCCDNFISSMIFNW